MYRFNLQIFADGGEGAQGAETIAAPEGVEQEVDAAADHQAKWKDLINGEFKDEFKKSFDDQLDRRFKKQQELEEKLERQSKLSAYLSQRYGIEDENPDKILEALQNDDALFEEEAAKRGLTTEQLKEVKRLEYENAMYQREQERAEADAAAQEIYADWVRQADDLKEIYPDFSLETELNDDSFVQMLQNGISLKHAFEVMHMDEIMTGVAAYTAQNVASRVTDGIRTKGMRPTENGVGRSTQPVKEVIDVENLSKDDINKLIERARRGERIVL